MMSAKVHGADALSAKLKRMMVEAPEVMEKALLKAAEPIRAEAEARAPESVKRWVPKGRAPKPGRLKKGIKTRRMHSTALGYSRVRIGVKEQLWYGRFPEYGTAKAAAQPFMRPALDTKQHEALGIFADEIKRGIG